MLLKSPLSWSDLRLFNMEIIMRQACAIFGAYENEKKKI